ncbi:MAG TPA: hypothetical protein VK766_04865 [Cytophagaceae bacterium]|jgi:hypothetical protein|nr:hypothetical protein [Cytophagaceae bacterium]
MNSLTLYFIKNNLAILLFIVICLSCQKPFVITESVALKTPMVKIKQGVRGKILFKEGDFSTSGEMLDNGKIYGVERQIMFYELTNIKDVEIGEEDFVKYVSTEIIDSVTSDKQGSFSKELPEGKYSLFVKEVNRLYSKVGDGDYYFPVTVLKDSCKSIIIEIDYKANYLSGQ